MAEEVSEIEEKFEDIFLKGVEGFTNQFTEGKLRGDDLLRCIKNLTEIYIKNKVTPRKEKG